MRLEENMPDLLAASFSGSGTAAPGGGRYREFKENRKTLPEELRSRLPDTDDEAKSDAADNYTLFREDQEHIKCGTSLHSECFCDFVRIPRHDGAPHTDSLPAVQYHGTLAGCQGLVALGPYGMPHQDCLLFQDCKFIS